MKYKQQFDGDVVIPRMTGYKMQCCDCGLVHTLDFTVVRVLKQFPNGDFAYKELDRDKYQVVFIPKRNNRATAASRRKK